MGGYFNESKTVGKTDLRKVQNHSPQGSCHGNLHEPEAQAEAGLTTQEVR